MSASSLRRSALSLLLLALLAGGAQAQSEAPPQAQPPADEDTASEAEMNDAFARMDSDRDGQLSLDEFMRGITPPMRSQREGGVVYQRLPARFRVLDRDADGYLDGSEYTALAQRWQGEGAPPPLADADRNGDGRIDFREFALVHAPREDSGAAVTATASAPAEAPPATR